MEILLARLSHLGHFEIAALATYLLLQGAVIAVFPEELIITTLGFLWSQDRISFVEALISVWLGLLPANTITVFLASRFGPKLANIRPFSWVLKKDAIEGSLSLIRTYGHWIVFMTRFTPVIRGPIYWAAGLSQFGVMKFFRTDVLASCIQVPALLVLGSVVGKSSLSLIDGLQKLGLIMAGMLVLALLGKNMFLRKKNSITTEPASEAQPSMPPLPGQSPT